MTTTRKSVGTAVLLSLLGWSTVATAVDQPISGAKLAITKVGTRESLVFVSRDPSFLFPPIGGTDDPGTGGALVELFSQGEGMASLSIPSAVGSIGWTTAAAAISRYKFANRYAPAGISPVRTALLRQGKVLKVVSKGTGLPMLLAQGTVGIRITTGSLRSCALFGPATIRRDVSGRFRAVQAPANAISDCSDASLGGASGCEASPFPTCGGPCSGDGVCTATFSGCQCISPSSPCGGTAPACSGTCPTGETCYAVGPGPFPGCVCLPEGSTPCGAPGPPVCGGECPSGTVCRPAYSAPIFGSQLGCTCSAPGGCGAGGLDCPNGFVCTAAPGLTFCAPLGCGGSPAYPACGAGTCVEGASCNAITDGGSFEACVCQTDP